MVLTGIKLALEQSSAPCTLWVVTDANAKDHSVQAEHELLELVTDQQCQVRADRITN
jgi:hypothetical protein